MQKLLICICVCIISTTVCAQDAGYKEVTISDGRILGRQAVTARNNLYFAFEDIPYAQPPVGPLRLKEPAPPQPWEEVLNTTANNKVCPQFSLDWTDIRENEDCLVLNVYTPVDPDFEHEELPVFIWIHGGSFVSFAGIGELWGADFFIDKRVIVVTLNYRLGPLGFLSTQDGVIPENLGLKDQFLAIKWVSKNINRFGGDRHKVTIGGQSAGAASVGYHVLNKQSTGLFRAAIMESGSPLNCWGLQKKARTVAYQLGSNLRSTFNTSSSSEELLSIVQSSTIDELQAASMKIVITLDDMNCHLYTSTPFAPVVETGDEENAIVLGMNHEKLKNGDINKVPILIGFNSQESLLFGTLGPETEGSLFDNKLQESITQNMNMADENKFAAGEEIRKLYSNSTYSANLAYAVNFASDCLFNTPITRHAILQSSYSDVYFYQFSYLGTLGRYVYYDVEGANGVGHQEELGYFWRNISSWDLSNFPKQDVIVHERAVDLWSQFIKHLNPTAEKSKHVEVNWPKITQNNLFYLDIDSDLSLKQYPKKYNEWSSIYSKYSEEKLDTY